MKVKKHYGKYPGEMNYYTACGLYDSTFYISGIDKATRIRKKVTCEGCKRTKSFKKGRY